MPAAVLEFGYLSRNVALSTAPARFLKELVRVGRYRHPARPDETIEITPARLRTWVANFYAAPVKVWVPYRHSADPQDNTGWVEDLFVDGDRLFGVLRITDERAAELLAEGTVEDVSVGVEAEFTDMTGRRWGELLRHVALTLDPHLRDQEGFIPLGLAAEVTDPKGGADLPTNVFAYVDPETGEEYYPHHDEQGNVDLAAVRAALQELAAAELDEETAALIREHLLAHLKESAREEAAEVTAEAADGRRLDLEARVAALDRANRRLKRNLRALETEGRRRGAAAVEQEVADLVAEGKVLPAFAPHVRAVLAAGENATLEFEGRPAAAATLLRELLAGSPPVVVLGERLSLSPPRERVPLSPAENAMLASLGLTESDYRRYASR